MKKISLRLRLTLLSGLVLILTSGILILGSIYNVESYILAPISQIIDNELNMTQQENTEDFPLEQQPISEKEILDDPGIVQLAINDTNIKFKNISFIFLGVVIVLGCFFTYFIAGKALKPVSDLSEEIQKIDEKGLSIRLKNTENKDEISKLTESFNIMLGKVEQAFLNQKQFSQAAAHELKTPLTVLRTSLEVLEIDENPQLEEYVQICDIFKRQTNCMITLVDDLFALHENNLSDFNEEFFADELFMDIESDLKESLSRLHITLSLNVPKIKLKGNKTMIMRAFSNLIENAIKYNSVNGQITVTASKKENEIIIYIQDTGIGIAEEHIDHIFAPFYRVDRSRSKKIGGSGLGLAITKNIIEAHNGTIEYIKNKPMGSVFKVKLPM